MKLKIIFIILITILLNTSLLFLYYDHILKDDMFDIVTRTAFLQSIYRLEESNFLTRSRDTVITEAVRIITPTVVSVNVWRPEYIRHHSFHDDFIGILFDDINTLEMQSIGSGVVFTSNGYIITNAHVVENATQIKVITHDFTEYDAILVGIDLRHDIAIIKIDTENLLFATLGSSNDLMIGEWSIAVGNPYGFWIKDSKPSISVGVISALERNFIDRQNSRVFRGMIQTDATINPGNSGGPLVNIYGEVIGINTFLLKDDGNDIEFGFAIPIDRIKRIAAELIDYNRIREAYFGFRIQEITPFIREYLYLQSNDGVIVSNVDQNGPAYIAGLRRGDIITMIDEIIIKNEADVEIAISDTIPGVYLQIRILRDGRQFELMLIAEEHYSG